MYQIALIIHVIVAIIGIGHTFIFPFLIKMPKNIEHVKFVWFVLPILSKVARTSDFILFITGIFMMLKGNIGLSLGWLNLAIILFFAMRFSSSVLSKKTSKDLYDFAQSIENENQMFTYKEKVKVFLPRLWTTQILLFSVMLLMVWKPYIPFFSF